MGLPEWRSISSPGPGAKLRQRWGREIKRLCRERQQSGFAAGGHPLAALRPWLGERGFVSAAQARALPIGARLKIAGEVVMAHTPPQPEGGRVMLVTIEDETGLLDLAISPRDQAVNAWVALACPLVLVWGRRSRRGKREALVTVGVVSPPPFWPGGGRRAGRGAGLAAGAFFP